MAITRIVAQQPAVVGQRFGIGVIDAESSLHFVRATITVFRGGDFRGFPPASQRWL